MDENDSLEPSQTFDWLEMVEKEKEESPMEIDNAPSENICNDPHYGKLSAPKCSICNPQDYMNL